MIILRENKEQIFEKMLQTLQEHYGSSLDSHRILYATIDALNNLFQTKKDENEYTDFSMYLNEQTGALLMILTSEEMTGLVLSFEMAKYRDPDSLDGMEALLNATRCQEQGIVSQDIQTNSF